MRTHRWIRCEFRNSRSLERDAGQCVGIEPFFVPVHIFSAPRVFCLLCKGLAEVVHVDDGKYLTLDFEEWREQSQLKLEFGLREPHETGYKRSTSKSKSRA